MGWIVPVFPLNRNWPMSHFGIETTQHVTLNYAPADVGSRMLATILDFFFLFVYYVTLSIAWGYFTETLANASQSISEYDWLLFVFIVFPIVFYDLVMESLWDGKTLGKWMAGVRVVAVNGREPSLSSYFIRWIFRLVEVYMFLGAIAYFAVNFNGKGQRLGDVAAKTMVVKQRKRIRLEETLYASLQDQYQPRITGIQELSDQDMRIVKEVLAAKREYDQNTWFVMLQKTRNHIEKKTQAFGLDMNADEFLNAVLEDYNHFHEAEAA
ncbi:MAG: RDD family protein [Bacteroidota bacterium]